MAKLTIATVEYMAMIEQCKREESQIEPFIRIVQGPPDAVCVLASCVSCLLETPFQHVIPSFQFLSVELRQVRVKGYTTKGEEKTYDMFVRNEPSLCRAHPAWTMAKDVTVYRGMYKAIYNPDLRKHMKSAVLL